MVLHRGITAVAPPLARFDVGLAETVCGSPAVFLSKQLPWESMAAYRSTSSKPLTAKEQAAWRAFVRALIVAPRVLDADLHAINRLNMADYHVLVLLSEEPGHAMRMSELAAQATLTASGLTRVVERLTRRGLAERARSETDGRGQVARLTEHGWQTLLETYPPHLHSVRTRVMRHLRELDLAAFTKAMERIAEEI
jgi:DNA-binding MarR family transcriptional regulator